MMLDRYKLIIFDWDGTLSTSSWIVKIARFFKWRYGKGYIERNKADYKVDSVTKLKKAEDISRTYSFFFSIYCLFYRPRLKHGVIELIKHLKKNGKKVAIFSDSNRYRLLVETKRLGMVDYVDFILSADSIDRFKPNPTGIIAIAQKFKKKRSQCLYVGDMAVDMYTAKFAGVDGCAVADGVDPYALLKSVDPVYIARNLEDMRNIK